ncbi:MAG: AraC family transcriptional regulator [Tsuneonella suprasediminis]|uniref:AraC family transcriptional regulator n=1 Tax=Tsuneonella suprasediminis TaxID=2306996 RepID=A0A419R547_9SPHN|nr:AraC family transcriptional regulator [Tsuneonella suprasediminis]RJX70758.1 AraC family transcriptional regulator [Tsuneonella suprasediminis]UBS34331.1 AraC family transcriptional regulator [Altererythrobacter sp. N1]
MGQESYIANAAPSMGGQVFNTRDFAPEARVQAWGGAVRSLHFSMAFDAHAETQFSAAFKSVATEDFRLVSFEEEGCSFRRDEEHIRDDPSTDIEFMTPLSGCCDVEQFGVRATCYTGQFVLFDASSQFNIVQPKQMSALMFKVSRREVDRRLSDIEASCGRIFPCVAGLPRLAVDLLCSINREIDSLSPVEFRASCAHFLDILAMSVNYGADTDAKFTLVREATFRRIKSFMRENSFDSELTTRKISHCLGLSERYVQALFQESGTTVRAFLMDLRLGRARDMLSGALHRRKSITQIAFECGFSSSAYFSTKFRESMEMTPTQYREMFS